MSEHVVSSGDTFERISRQVYGTEAEAGRIARANPGATEPLSIGTVLIIPPSPLQVADRTAAASSSNVDEVALLIDGERFRFWTDLSITQSVDGIAAIEISAPFDPNNPELREFFKPFGYKNIVVTVGGELLFTGTLLTPEPSLDAENVTFTNQGYALPGVLADCTISVDALPAEFFDSTLQQVTDSLIEPFGLQSVFDLDPGPIFEEGVTAEPTTSLWNFLVKLGKQRNGIFNSDSAGRLRFTRPTDVGNPSVVLKQGEPPLLSVAPKFNARRYYSHVTGLQTIGTFAIEGSDYTVKNPHITNVLRPHNFRVPDTFGGTVKEAAEGEAGRMLGNAASYLCNVATWRKPDGTLWAADDTIALEAPGAMVYSPYSFKVREVVFRATPDSREARLSLVLPGSFTGDLPETLPWD